MAPSRRIAALVAVTALAVSACTSNDADAGDIEEAMLDAGLPDDQASCIAEQLDSELDQGQLNDLAGASSPDEFPEGLEQTVTAAVDDCVGDTGASGEGEGDEGDDAEGTDSTEGAGEGGEPSDSTEPTSATTAGEGSSATTATTAG